MSTDKYVLNVRFNEMMIRNVCEYIHYSITISTCKYKEKINCISQFLPSFYFFLAAVLDTRQFLCTKLSDSIRFFQQRNVSQRIMRSTDLPSP